ncbi:MAG: hypothetical protein Q7K29_00965 [Thermoleophilia bacterium]|nr:hypothetical protein [Thermoleophilia bacterium]
MRLTRIRMLVAAAALILIALQSLTFMGGCGDESSSDANTNAAGGSITTLTTPVEAPVPFIAADQTQTVPEEQPSPYGAGLTGSQSVGTLVDGLQLRDIRWSDHGTYYRIVFEMGTPEGDQVLQVPHADATMSADGTQIKVVLGGIRSIGTNESVTSSSLDLGDPVVTTLKRLQQSDDQSLAYSIELASPSTYSLAGLGSPGRIVVDITKP